MAPGRQATSVTRKRQPLGRSISCAAKHCNPCRELVQNSEQLRHPEPTLPDHEAKAFSCPRSAHRTQVRCRPCMLRTERSAHRRACVVKPLRPSTHSSPRLAGCPRPPAAATLAPLALEQSVAYCAPDARTLPARNAWRATGRIMITVAQHARTPVPVPPPMTPTPRPLAHMAVLKLVSCDGAFFRLHGLAYTFQLQI